MRIVGCLGCLLAGLDQFEKAMGTTPQVLFSKGNEWVWFGGAAIWFMCSAVFAIQAFTQPR